jgi:hypothetical protein
MSDQKELSWMEAISIGVLGGLCLVLLKLVQARFYLDDPLSKEALVAYLTYGVFLVFGGVAGVFFTEDNIKRNTFIAGLLAPSILLTFFSAPNFRVDSIGEAPKEIKQLSVNVIAAAHAQETAPSAKQEIKTPALEPPISSIRKSDVELTFKEAFLLALGRPQKVNSYLFIIGKTPDKAKAIDTAASINYIIKGTQAAKTDRLPPAKVIQIEGTEDYFVTLGALQTSSAALGTKKVAYSAALDLLNESRSVPTTTTAPLLLEGKVIDTREFFH